MSEDEANEASQSGSKRERSPAFPYLDLDSAIELIKKLYSAARGSDVRIGSIAEAWGLSPKSGSLLRYVAALSQFGLITPSGSGEQRKIKISQTGRRIIEDDRPGVRETLCAEAAQSPKIISELFYGSDRIGAWGHDRPDDNIAESALKFDLGFTSDAAKKLLSVYDSTIKFLPKAAHSGKVTDGVSWAEEQNEEPLNPKVQLGDTIQWVSNDIDQFPEPKRVRSISEDKQWVLVDGSDTGIPISQVIVVAAPVKSLNSKREMTATQPAKPDLELNQIHFKSESEGVITITARVDASGLEILQKKLEAFKLLLS